MQKFGNETNPVQKLLQALTDKDINLAEEAGQDVIKGILNQMEDRVAGLQKSNDSVILAQRGHRQLTSEETNYYEKLIAASKSANPRETFIKTLSDDAMPQTIIEDVFKDLRQDHPLLGAIDFQYVGQATKWILNDHATQKAIWGTITDAITKEITSAFKVIDVKQNKLSAYSIIENGMLDRGPEFLDKYIREALAEALLEGLEEAIVKGNGVKQPVGLIKDIHKGVEFNSETGYPDKQKIAVTSFAAKEYGELAAKMAKTENGKLRKFSKLGLICNQNDYLKKVMPATTAFTTGAQYVGNCFPIATDVFVSNALADGEAVLFLPEEYFLGIGGDKSGLIEISNDCKFIEDQTVYKTKEYGAGRPFDNTSALFLDIKNLKELYVTVENVTVPVV